jgi:hypothetical protein
MALETAVRNFQLPTALSRNRVVQQVAKVSAQRARLRWGAVGTLPSPSTGGFNTLKDNKYVEKTRNGKLLKITNPDDSSQYVIVESAQSAFFARHDPNEITVSWQKTYTMYGAPLLTGSLAPAIVNVQTDQQAPKSEYDFLDPTHGFG